MSFLLNVLHGKKVAIEHGQHKINGRFYAASGENTADIAILFLSGWRPGSLSITTMDYYGGYFAKKHDIASLTVSLRGQGSPGNISKLTRKDFLDDAIAAFDFLKASCPDKRIMIVGESLGSYLGSIVSSYRKVDSLILRVPTDFPDSGFSDVPQIKFAMNKTREWKSAKHRAEESLALNAVRKFDGNILIVSSGKDTIIPFQTIANYLAAKDEGTIHHIEMNHSGHGLLKRNEINRFRDIVGEQLGLRLYPNH